MSADDLVHEMQELGAQLRRAEAEQRKRDLAEYRAQVPAKRAKAKPVEPSERELQQGVVKWLRTLGCICSATQNERGAASDDPGAAARFGASRKRSGVTPGFPDLTVLTPAGRVGFIEMKARRGTVSAEQRALHAWMHSHGFVVIVARSIDDVADGFAAAGIPLDRAGLRLAAPVEPLAKGAA